MNARDEAREADPEEWHQKDYFYDVLNLPVFASLQEIKERHRSLSLIFHPDKHHDPKVRDAAVKKFLEIQKAYEVLTDPFQRTVYDTLGYVGLKLQFPSWLHELPIADIPDALRQTLYNSRTLQLNNRLQPYGRISAALDVSELFSTGVFSNFSERMKSVGFTGLNVNQGFIKPLTPQTELTLSAKMKELPVMVWDSESGSMVEVPWDEGNVSAALRHRINSKISVKASLDLVRRSKLMLSSEYREAFSDFKCEIPLRLSFSRRHLPPPVTLSYERRLSQVSTLTGQVVVRLSSRVPTTSIRIIKPAILRKESDAVNNRSLSESVAFGWLYGLSLTLAQGGPGLLANWHVKLREPRLMLSCGVEANLAFGLLYRLSGAWQTEDELSGIAADVEIGGRGVVLEWTGTHLGQTISVPIVFSHELSYPLAVLATALPSAVFAFLKYQYLKEKKRNARLSRQIDSENGEIARRKSEAEEAVSILRDNANRVALSERRSNGLIILNAEYFPIGSNGEPYKEFAVDVTVPLQTLVHGSQLYIPSRRTKSTLRGFYDPFPGRPKRLAVRYEFQGKPHFAEVSDSAALVLPLEGHLIERQDVL